MGFPQNDIFTGEVSGSATAKQLPILPGSLVVIKAVASNTGNVYVGAAGVTKVDGTTDATTGIELAAGETTGWLRCRDLSQFYIICDNAGDDITYMILN